MQAQLDLVGATNYQWFSAIRPDGPDGFDTIGARGCYLSHLGVLREAVGLPSVVILEDDLDFTAEAKSHFPKALAALPPDWGIFYGSHFLDGAQATGPVFEVTPDTEIVTAAFFAVNGAVIPSLVTYLEEILARPAGHPDGGQMHVDGAYGWFRKATGCKVFASSVPLGWQRPSRTDIHKLAWYDTMPVLSSMTQAARKLRRALRS
jgi:hypothetical protein